MELRERLARDRGKGRGSRRGLGPGGAVPHRRRRGRRPRGRNPPPPLFFPGYGAEMVEGKRMEGAAVVCGRAAPLTAAGKTAGRGADERPPPPVYCAAQGKEKRMKALGFFQGPSAFYT
jgi:hypothetical protein